MRENRELCTQKIREVINRYNIESLKTNVW